MPAPRMRTVTLLAALTLCGGPGQQVLVAAPGLGLDGDIGSVEEGKLADLVASRARE